MKQKLPYPDTSHHEPGAVQRETIRAMRKAKGDRAKAAAALGITRNALAARLCGIRSRLAATHE